MSLATSRPPLKTRYQFIEEPKYGGRIEKKGRKNVRRHVMLEHMRQKRRQEKGQVDRDTVLEQKGFKVDSREIGHAPPRSRDPVAVIPLEPATNVPARSAEDEGIEEIPRRDIQNLANSYDWLGFS